MNYILITPIKNEASNLLKLKETILNQTLKPVLWTIVDSGSSDLSYRIASELFADFNWIKIIRQNNFLEIGYSHKNFAQAINEGYEYSRQFCEQKGLQYSYIGKTDATPILSKDYFECLIQEMQNDKDLVVTCGIQILNNNGKMIPILPNNGLNNLSGFNDIRLYRKGFFDDINGYPITYSPDTVILIKAIQNNQKILVSNKTSFIKNRLGGSKIGVWNGYFLKGKGMYILGYHPLLMLMNALFFSVTYYPHYQGIAVIFGYLTNFFNNTEKINDKQIRVYFREKRIKEIIGYFIIETRKSL